MRAALIWTLAIVGGIALVLVATAMIGSRDKSNETVSPGDWAQSVCGAVGTWRGEMEAIIDDVRQQPSTGASGVEEPQSETPQATTGLVRSGLEQSIRATKTLVTGVDNAGVPDTDQGEAAAQQVSSWADSSVSNLEKAQGSLDQEAPTLEEAVLQFAAATSALRVVLVGGVETLADVALLDPELTTAVRESSTCQQLKEEQSST